MPSKKKTINLNGPEGNAFCLLGYGRHVCKATGREWEPIQAEMTSGDYDNLVKVFKKNFGDYFKLVRE
jgi:hypothetical protein